MRAFSWRSAHYAGMPGMAFEERSGGG